MSKTRLFLIVAITLAVIGSFGVAIGYLPTYVSKTENDQKEGKVKISMPFTLINHDGQVVTNADFHGRYLLVYFGYTFCPDICPTALHTMMTAYSQLTPEQKMRIVPLFVTVDSERDTVERIKSYVSAFHPALIGLTGTVEQTTTAAKAYKVFFSKTKSEVDKPYLIDHSSIIYIVDPGGYYYAHCGHDSPTKELVEKLRSLPWPSA